MGLFGESNNGSSTAALTPSSNEPTKRLPAPSVETSWRQIQDRLFSQHPALESLKAHGLHTYAIIQKIGINLRVSAIKLLEMGMSRSIHTDPIIPNSGGGRAHDANENERALSICLCVCVCE